MKCEPPGPSETDFASFIGPGDRGGWYLEHRAIIPSLGPFESLGAAHAEARRLAVAGELPPFYWAQPRIEAWRAATGKRFPDEWENVAKRPDDQRRHKIKA